MSKEFKELVCAKRGNQPTRQFVNTSHLAMKINEIVNAACNRSTFSAPVSPFYHARESFTDSWSNQRSARA